MYYYPGLYSINTYQRIRSKDCIPSKGVFHLRLSSIKGHFPSKVLVHWRCSSAKLCQCPKFQTFFLGFLLLIILFLLLQAVSCMIPLNSTIQRWQLYTSNKTKMKTTSKWRWPHKWRRHQTWRWPEKWTWPQKLAHPLKKFCHPPPLPLKYYLIFFWWPLTLTATPQLMLNSNCYQVSKPEIEFHMMDIMYTALHMHAHT